jgi:hypothetical protein
MNDIKLEIMGTNLLKELYKRWQTETPHFWKRVRAFAITLGSSAIAVWTINTTMGLNLYPLILEICKYIITACAVLGFSAQITKND